MRIRRLPSTILVALGSLPMLFAPAPLAAWAYSLSPPLDPQASEVRWRQVGFLPNQAHPCPLPSPGWNAPAQVDAGGERYCIYEFVAGTVTPADISALEAATALTELAPDRMAVRPSGAIDHFFRARQSELFRRQVGEVHLPAPLPGSARIHLALLDTQPSGGVGEMPAWDENSAHGRTLRRFADFLLCKVQPCPIRSHSRLSLPHTDFHATDPALSPRDEIYGGLFGTVSELGEQLVEEVAEWTATADPGSRLVINLSVAWDGTLFGGLETDGAGAFDPLAMPVDVRLVHRALQDASEAGILVIAASGNRADHRQADGALLPAAWERAPSPAPMGSSTSAYRPLLYAVSGVDSLGDELALAQPLARTSLAAYADRAVLENDGSGPTGLLTGSSVSALVVSVAAAAAWSYAPELDLWELMDQVYLSADGLWGSVELCLPDPTSLPCASVRPGVRRVSICRAVEQVCTSEGGCPPPFDPGTSSPCEAWAPEAPDLSGLEESPFVPLTTSFHGSSVSIDPGPPCAGLVEFPATGPASPDPCPTWQYHGLSATPWVRPQPGSNPCPSCPILDDSLYIEVAADFEGALSSPSLLACGRSVSLAWPEGLELAATDTHRIDGVSVPGCPSGLLSFVATDVEGADRRSTVSPIRISSP